MGILEHVTESAKERLDGSASLDEVDEDVVGLGEEDVLQVSDDEHRRLCGSSLFALCQSELVL